MDFFTEDEVKHFLKCFTIQGYPVSNSTNLNWMDTQITWPRKLTSQIELREAAIRYDINKKDVYRQDVWNGLYTKEIFDKIDASEERFPPNFEELLNSTFGVEDESVFTIRLDSNETLNPSYTDDDAVSETPYDDGKPINPKWEKWAEKKYRDPSWRREAKDFYTRLIKSTLDFNSLNKGIS